MCKGTRIDQVGIDLHGLSQIPVDLRPGVGGTRESVRHHHRVEAAERGVGQREVLVALDSALQELAGSQVLLFLTASLKVPCQQVEIVGFGVGLGAAGPVACALRCSPCTRSPSSMIALAM